MFKKILVLAALSTLFATAHAAEKHSTESIYLTYEQAPISYFHNGIPNSVGEGSLVLKRIERTGSKIIEKTCFATPAGNLLKFRQGRGGIFSTSSNSNKHIGPRDASEIRHAVKIIRENIRKDAGDKSLVTRFEGVAYEIQDLEFSDKEDSAKALMDIRRALQNLCD